MEIIQITKEEFDKFADNCPYKNFYQTSAYGMLMDRHSFDDYYLAMRDDFGNIKAATLILITKAFIGYKWGYCPRGYLIDFNDFELVKNFTQLIKIFLNKRNFMFIKIDPYIIYKSHDKDGKIIPGIDNSNIVNNLLELGYIHNGFNLNFENLKPRWNAVTTVNETVDIFPTFNKEIRNKVRKAEKMGLEIIKGGPENIKEFYSLIDQKHSRKLNYYLDMYEILGKNNMFEIYFAVINTPKYIENSKKLYEEEEKRNNAINLELEENVNNNNTGNIIKRKMASDAILNTFKQNIINATNLYKEYPTGIVIGANAIIKYNKEIFFLIDGYKKEYRNYCPNHYLKYQIMEKYRQQGFTRMHLNGISGDFSKNNPYYGLTKFKLGFGANIEEYIGEFTLVINKGKYNSFKKINPIITWWNTPLFKKK
mgnify:FL=1